MLVKVLLHAVYKAAIYAYGAVTDGTFEMKMIAVTAAEAVHRALALYADVFGGDALFCEKLKATVNGSL